MHEEVVEIIYRVIIFVVLMGIVLYLFMIV